MNRLSHFFKKLFFASYTDKKVEAIQAEIEKKTTEATKAVNKYNRLLKANGVTMQIVVASGAEDGKH